MVDDGCGTAGAAGDKGDAEEVYAVGDDDDDDDVDGDGDGDANDHEDGDAYDDYGDDDNYGD